MGSLSLVLTGKPPLWGYLFLNEMAPAFHTCEVSMLGSPPRWHLVWCSIINLIHELALEKLYNRTWLSGLQLSGPISADSTDWLSQHPHPSLPTPPSVLSVQRGETAGNITQTPLQRRPGSPGSHRQLLAWEVVAGLWWIRASHKHGKSDNVSGSCSLVPRVLSLRGWG